MRILHLTNTLVDRGNGIINVAVDLAIEQAKCGHEVAFVAGGGGYQPLLAERGITHYLVPEGRQPQRLGALIRSHYHAFTQFKPELVHAHMRAGLLATWPLAKRAGVPILGHVHNVQEWQSRLFLLADAVIAVSESVKLSMRKVGIKANKLHVVLNGPLGSCRLPRSGSTVTLGHPAIVSVAGMNERKGILELIDAFSLISNSYPTACLYLVGDGPDKNRFETKAALSPASSRIFFEGFHLDPRPYMRAADIFVLASRRESLGLVLVEAREQGCAIVATEVDGIPEALDGGEAGVLIAPHRPEILAEALMSLLNNSERRCALSEKARQGLDRFTTRRMADNVQLVYEDVMNQNSQGPL